MTPDQVSGFFDAGEAFVEGTIARGAGRPVDPRRGAPPRRGRTWSATTGKFTLRLGADLWWIIYVALRDIILLQVFLGSFIFFYPDVITGQDLPITGGLARRLRLRRPADQAHDARAIADLNGMRAQVLLVGLGAVLYIGPYFFGSQMTDAHRPAHRPAHAAPRHLQEPRSRAAARATCPRSLIGIMGVVAVGYNLRQTTVLAGRRPRRRRPM